MDTCVCMAQSLRCSSETITTLLIGYTPIQNKKILKKKEIGFKHKEDSSPEKGMNQLVEKGRDYGLT